MGRKSASNQCIGFRLFGNAGTTTCLKCLEKFESPDKSRVRFCPGCKVKNQSVSGTHECRVMVDSRFVNKD
jgi:Zn finger protein HypA/HybF involved in hydrogenase expression